MEGLCGLVRDRDRDVRESAVVALGQICDSRAIYPLVLSLLDPESSVRNAAVNALQNVDRHWEKTEGVRQALPEIKAALNHRDYWIRNCAAKLLEQLKVDPNPWNLAYPRPSAITGCRIPGHRPAGPGRSAQSPPGFTSGSAVE